MQNQTPSTSSRLSMSVAFAVMALVFSVVSFAAEGDAESVVFSRDVAPILMENCAHCHRPGEIAPMSLLSYGEARPWAKSIKKVVANREMPPWFAEAEHGPWANDTSLSDDEIRTIVAWVDQGAVEGDPALMPPPPVFTTGWQLGEPDYVFALPKVEIPADGPDLHPTPIMRLDLPERRWVRAVEVRPGDPEVNHHQVLFMAGGMGGDESQRENGRFNILAVWAAGTAPTVFPEGTGRWLSPGDLLVLNQHYHPNGVDARTDVTRVGLYFGEGEPDAEVSAVIAGTMDFKIPAGAENHELRVTHTLLEDVRIISYFPHMHLRGTDMTFIATRPDGTKETLLHVPNYNFDWQLFYYPEEPKHFPKGTEIEIIAHYNNSESNEFNPDPTRDVGFGLQTTDEMMFGVFEMIADVDLKKDSKDGAD